MKKKKKNKQDIFLPIALIINFFMLVFAIIVLTVTFKIGIILTLIPLSIGTLIFAILKKIKRYELNKALKYASITYVSTYMLVLVLFLLIIQPTTQTITQQTLRINPIIEECINKCQDTSKEIRECIENCLK